MKPAPVLLRPVGLDVCYRTRFPPPGVINQQFRIDAEKPVQEIFIMEIPRTSEGAARDISHGKEPVLLQSGGISLSDPPEIRQRPVIPEKLPVAEFI